MFGSALVPCVTSAQTTFQLGFSGPGDVRGGPGDQWAADFDCVLSSEGAGTGAQGWSIGMAVESASINAITTDGTIVDGIFSGGFKKSEVTTKGTGGCAGKSGAVSAVVLSFTEPVTSPAPPSAVSIAKISVSGTAPDCFEGANAMLRFVDGCQGVGQPVQNTVTQDGFSVTPRLGSLDIRFSLHCQDCIAAMLNVGFSARPVSSPVGFDGIVDDGSGLGSAGGGSIFFDRVDPSRPLGHVYANIVSNNAGTGVQGWSLSIALDGDINFGPGGATTNGTPGVDNYFSGGFKKTEIVDPAKNEGQRGVVSAIVLSFTETRVLPPTGTETVLDMELMPNMLPDFSHGPVVGQLSYRSGLRGSGQPVNNAITVQGATASVCNFGTAQVGVVFTVPGDPVAIFVRGNANDDAKVNLADLIYIINLLFRAGPDAPCPPTVDANADGLVDLSDATYLINYLLVGGAEPPAPFPDCGSEPAAGISAACLGANTCQ